MIWGFVVRWEIGFFSGGGGGGGSRLLNLFLFYSLKRGSNGFITHFPGGGVQLFPGVGVK